MTALSPLLTRLAARYRLADGLWRFTRAAWLGPLAALALLAGARLRPLAGDRLWALGLGVGVVLVLALLVWRRRVDPLAAAVRTDRALGLRDRLATAWLLAGESDVGYDTDDDGPPVDDDRPRALRRQLVARQLADALAAAACVDLRTVAPLRWARRPLLAWALFTVGAIALALLPNPQHAELARRAAVKTTAGRLAQDVRRTEAGLTSNEALTAEESRQAAAALRRLTEALERSQGRAETDLAAVAEAETALRQGLNQDALRRAAAARGLSERLAALSREARRAAADSVTGDPVAPYPVAATPSASDGQSSADLKRLAAAAATMDQAARDRLAQALQDEARAADLDQPEAARQLAALAEAVSQGDPADAGRSAQSLSDSLDAARDSAAGARSVQDALAALQAGRSALAQANASGQPADPAAIADGARVADVGAAAEGARDGSMGQGPQGRPGAGDGSAEGTGPQGEGAGQQQGTESGQGTGQAEADSGQGQSAGQAGSGPGQGADSGTTSAGSAPAQSGDGSGGGSGSGSGGGFGRSGRAGAGNGAVNDSGATDASRPGGAPSSAALGAAAGLVYASPQRLATAGERSFVPGRIAGDPGAGQQSERPSRQPGLVPPARVPYRDVLPAYREAAGRALARETIPLSRRDYVRAYFAQLED